MFNFVHWSMPFGKSCNPRVDSTTTPFADDTIGGYKESGIGRECGDAALENYTETKTVYWNMGMPPPTDGSK